MEGGLRKRAYLNDPFNIDGGKGNMMALPLPTRKRIRRTTEYRITKFVVVHTQKMSQQQYSTGKWIKECGEYAVDTVGNNKCSESDLES